MYIASSTYQGLHQYTCPMSYHWQYDYPFPIRCQWLVKVHIHTHVNMVTTDQFFTRWVILVGDLFSQVTTQYQHFSFLCVWCLQQHLACDCTITRSLGAKFVLHITGWRPQWRYTLPYSLNWRTHRCALNRIYPTNNKNGACLWKQSSTDYPGNVKLVCCYVMIKGSYP